MGKQKLYEDLCFSDDFLFCRILENNPDLCKELLELAIGEEIGGILEVQQQKPVRADFEAKGVRFDVYARDNQSKRYDCEMQTYREKHWENEAGFMPATWISISWKRLSLSLN